LIYLTAKNQRIKGIKGDREREREKERERQRERETKDFLFCCCIMEFTAQGGAFQVYQIIALLHTTSPVKKKE
jgi:hypothetical protein